MQLCIEVANAAHSQCCVPSEFNFEAADSSIVHYGACMSEPNTSLFNCVFSSIILVMYYLLYIVP